jgi:RNA methyltransferase, TrmH family
MALSKNNISLIKSLDIKKYRDKHNLFIAEGAKIVNEMLSSNWPLAHIFASEKYAETIVLKYPNIEDKLIVCTDNEIKKISRLNSPPELIVLAYKQESKIDVKSLKSELCIALDCIQDPGNLGTIIRLCNWFGINNIICSTNSADLYNPKVVQASMGGFIGVNLHYVDLPNFIKEYKTETANPVYGTFMQGEDLRQISKAQQSLIVFGNEGKGIGNEIEKLIDTKLTIPSTCNNTNCVESLNISTAASVIVSAFKLG